MLLVWNAVAHKPTPSKSRLESRDGVELGFLWRAVSLIGAYQDFGWGYTLRSRAEAAFRPVSAGGVCALLIVSISLPLRVQIPIPRDLYPPIPTPEKPFNVPPGSRRDTIEIQDPFTYGMSFKTLTAPPRAFTSVPSPGDTIETKTIQAHKFHPFGFHLPHITRSNSVEDVELPFPFHFPNQRLD